MPATSQYERASIAEIFMRYRRLDGRILMVPPVGLKLRDDLRATILPRHVSIAMMIFSSTVRLSSTPGHARSREIGHAVTPQRAAQPVEIASTVRPWAT